MVGAALLVSAPVAYAGVRVPSSVLPDKPPAADEAPLIRAADKALTDTPMGVEPLVVHVVVSSVSPLEGSTEGGTPVTIAGENFESGAIVEFGGAQATAVTVVSPDEITAETPPHVAGPVTVTVKASGVTGQRAEAFTYVTATPAEPFISSVSPPEGSTEGGTPVTIAGENFGEPGASAKVEFGGAAATNVDVVSSTEITATTSPHAAGPVTVAVTTSTGTGKSSQKAHLYAYVPEPNVRITSPSSGSVAAGTMQLVTGEAGIAEGDSQEVTVNLFQGSTQGTLVESHRVLVSHTGQWSTTLGPLVPGTYSVDAEQYGETGPPGVSPLVTFTMEAPVTSPSVVHADSPPTASFTWFPQYPKVEEQVGLSSNSTDSQSPITSFAWSTTNNNIFQAAGPVYTTSFATPGNHSVSLRVTSADGLSTVATRVIVVSPYELSLMQPFPVVRIVGTYHRFGVTLSLLTVEAPADTKITVQCKGHRCPLKSLRHAVAATRHGLATVAFRRLERHLPAGVRLIIRIFAPDKIGKYTRFVIRRGEPPKRVDACVGPTGGKPIACPLDSGLSG
jgi:IPT/TIG domain